MLRIKQKIFSISCQKGYLLKEKLFSPFHLALVCFLQRRQRVGKDSEPLITLQRRFLGYLGVFWGNVFIVHQQSFQVCPHGEWENAGSTADRRIGWEMDFPGKDVVPAGRWAEVPQNPLVPREAPICSAQKCLKCASTPTTSVMLVPAERRERNS